MSFAGAELVWRSAPTRLRLDRHQVDVWQVRGPLAQERLGRLRAVLSPDEKARAGRFVVEHAREAFVTARASLRVILSRYLGCDPGGLAFTYGPQGKPSLADLHETSGIEFNVSHTAHLVLVAVARNRPLGIDVEWARRDIDHEPLARRFFARSETQRLLEQVRPEARRAAFFRCWTRKEAYL